MVVLVRNHFEQVKNVNEKNEVVRIFRNYVFIKALYYFNLY